MPNLSRRHFMIGTSCFALTALAGVPAVRAAEYDSHLVASPREVSFFGDQGLATSVWSYGATPGPTLRFKQGQNVRIKLSNELPDPTTVHWHGLRIENAMDGVPFLNQKPIAPGESFIYDFLAKDAGTYWYHPHVNSAEQVGRGLSGAIVVEEPEPIVVDRDLVWVVDDWRLRRDGTLAPFDDFHDATHGGRMGNVVTINGEAQPRLSVRRGERIRLRLINAANARVFGLKFPSADVWRVAVDGHPVDPSQVAGDELVMVSPGGRIDLILDMNGEPGETTIVEDHYYPRYSYAMAEIEYSTDPPIRSGAPAAPKRLAENPVAIPDLAKAERHEMLFEGGAMGGLRQAEYKGEVLGLRDLAGMGLVWAVNGKMIPPMTEADIGSPMLTMERGKSYVLSWHNKTAFDHPIHLHGHSFHLISTDGKRLEKPIIMDTVLIQPDQSVEVAFIADNPGDWALHCHVLEHAEAGMMGFVRVV